MTSRNFAYTESISCYFVKWGFPGGLALKNLPAMQETRVQFLGQEDLPLEKERAIHSSILAGKSHGKRSLAGYNSQGCKESDMTEAERLSMHACNRYLIVKAFHILPNLISPFHFKLSRIYLFPRKWS